MISVCGRKLKPPSVYYKGQKTAEKAPGGWNLKGNEFEASLPNALDNKLKRWGCLKFYDSSKYDSAMAEFRKILRTCGIQTDEPFTATLNEAKMRTWIQKHHEQMDILLIILPAKETALYNRMKRLGDGDKGIHTVCVIGGPKQFYKCNGTYCANVALKFNLKLKGTNHKLGDSDLGIISQGKTMVVGIDVVHPSPGTGKASVASMVASIDKDLAQWPVDLRVQVREGQEMLDKIGIMLQSRLDLWAKKHGVFPENILVYRDGVSESQYKQVLDTELEEMQTTSRSLYEKAKQPRPQFTLVIVGKRHHTRFFPPENSPHCDGNGNFERGIVVDRGITEARNWDFFLQSHDALKGTARPAHYYVLWDEIFTNTKLEPTHKVCQPGLQPADRLEQVTHSMCYLFGRATKAVKIPAPVYYADIACERAGRYLVGQSTDAESTTSDNRNMTAAQRDKLCGELQVKIKVHDRLKDDMFYI